MKRMFNKMFVPKDVDSDERYLKDQVKFYSLDRYADTENALCKILEQIFQKCQEEKEELVAKLCHDYVDLMLRRSVGSKDYLSKMEKIYEKTDGTGGVCGATCDNFKFVYYCLDCQQGDSAIMCPPCFSDSNHQGHRAYRDTNVGGYCDCGDPALWDPKGYCPDHTGKINIDDSWKESKRTEFQQYLIKGLFPIIQVWDRHSVKPVKHVQILGLLVKDFIIPALTQMWGISDPVAVKTVIANSLTAPITCVARDCVPRLFHRHDDLLAPKPNNKEREDCRCSLLSLILRFALQLNTTEENEANPVNEFLSDLCAVPSFKKELSLEYFRHIRFLYNTDPKRGDITSSDLLDKQFLLLGSLSTQEELIKQCDVLAHLNCLKDLLLFMLKSATPNSRTEMYQKMLTPIMYLVDLFLVQDTPSDFKPSQEAETAAEGPIRSLTRLKIGLAEFFADILAAFDAHAEDMISGTSRLQENDAIEGLYQQLVADLMGARYLLAVCSNLANCINSLSPSDKTTGMVSLLQQLALRLQASHGFSEERKTTTNFASVTEAVFVQLMLLGVCTTVCRPKQQLREFDADAYKPLKTLIWNGSPGLDAQAETLVWRRVAFACAKSLGLTREMQRGLWVSCLVLT